MTRLSALAPVAPARYIYRVNKTVLFKRKKKKTFTPGVSYSIVFASWACCKSSADVKVIYIIYPQN